MGVVQVNPKASIKVPSARIVVPESDIEWILQEVRQALGSGQLTLGRHGKEFEQRFAERVGVKYAVAVNSGTASLEIILRAIGVEGKDVVVPTNTFIATAAAAVHAGARVRFADINPGTLCLDADQLRAALTDRTAAVIVVHIGGAIPPDMARIQQLCASRKIALIEDAAHAHGASLAGQPAGTFGAAASFSFYPTKVMTSAEGGMLVTNEQAIYEAALVYRDQGKESFTSNVHTRLGYNWRMSELHAIVGRAQLNRLEEFVAQRRHAAARYDRLLKGVPGITPIAYPPEVESNYYKYPAMLDPGIDRAELKRRLRSEHGVSLSGEVYELPCHQQPVFASTGDGRSFPEAEAACRRQVCLPVYATMRDEEVQAVVDALQQVLPEMMRTGSTPHITRGCEC